VPLASELYCSVGMKKSAANRRPAQLLRWVFRRGNRFITCQLDRESRRAAYMLSLVPHWDVRQAVIENFDAGASAFQRHAVLADHLRQNGWTLASYTVGR
jgi:hypothetical protein